MALAIDLYCGLGGWTDGLLAEGYEVIGFDIEAHEYGDHRYPAQLVLQDVLTLHGAQFKDATLIVASPPCQEYSYMAMPWTRAKQIAAALRGNGDFPAGYTGSRTVEELNRLFDACFRIQREACEAAGRHIPLIVENVRGAIPWVGRSRWNFGSFHLWGDVPALIPLARQFKSSVLNWSDPEKRGQDFTRVAGAQAVKNAGHLNIRDGHSHTRHLTNPREHGLKVPGLNLSEKGFNVAARQRFDAELGDVSGYVRSAEDRRRHIGASRKFASAMIAKIPLPLSRHIASVFKPNANNVIPYPYPEVPEFLRRWKPERRSA